MNCFFPFYLRGNHPTNITISSHNQTSINGEKDIIPFTAITITYLFSTIANFSLIFGLKKTNTKLTISQKLYIYLSFTDAFFSLIMFVMVLLEFLPAIAPASCTITSMGTSLATYTCGLSLGTFLSISYLRNQAIRKPFNSVIHKAVYLTLAGWNVITLATSILVFFAYEPTQISKTLYAFSWTFIGTLITVMVILVVFLNGWSKNTLSRQSRVFDSQNEIEIRRRKLNKTAVAILNIISFIYVLCVLPLGIYYVIIGVLTWIHEDDLLLPILHISRIMNLPLFPCSGLNSLAYMLKDKAIRKFYKRWLCCKGKEYSP